MNDIQTLMRSANPIPDAKQEFTDGDVKALLTLTMTRSGEMQTQQPQKVEAPRDQRRRGWLVAAVAFAIVIAVGAVAMLLQQSDSVPPATVPIPTPTTTVAESTPTTLAQAPTTTQPEQPTTTVDAAEAAWLAQTPWRRDMNGDYRTNLFGTPFGFSTAGVDWGSQIETNDWLYIQSDFGGLDIFRIEGSVEQAVADWIQMHDSFENATMNEPEPISVGGADGFRIESVGLPRNVADIAEPSLVLFSGVDGGVPAGPAGLVYVVDVGGQTVVLAFNDDIFDPGPGEIEAAAAQARAIIDSIIWKELG